MSTLNMYEKRITRLDPYMYQTHPIYMLKARVLQERDAICATAKVDLEAKMVSGVRVDHLASP